MSGLPETHDSFVVQFYLNSSLPEHPLCGCGVAQAFNVRVQRAHVHAHNGVVHDLNP